MDYEVVYDPTVFVRESIRAVVYTLLEAVVLVVLVVTLFLQTWRASMIPLLAVPVSIIGTFAVLYLLGFSINTLTLFALVLAVGIVVDDAIVVVENVERHIADGLKPVAAAHQAMREVSGPIIAITLVLCAVFVPMAFLEGVTGEFYRQFAVTIAVATVISGFNSLTLSPALAATLLRAHDAPRTCRRASSTGCSAGCSARSTASSAPAPGATSDRDAFAAAAGRGVRGVHRAAGRHRRSCSRRCPADSSPPRTSCS
jgi:multidrug efflux pump